MGLPSPLLDIPYPHFYPCFYVAVSRVNSNIEAINKYVQGNEDMATEPVHEATRQGRHPLLYSVRPSTCLLFSFTLNIHCTRSLTFLLNSTRKLTPRANSRLIRRTFYDVKSIIQYGYGIADTVLMLCVDYFTMTLMYTMLPRFILGMREMYDRDCHRHRQGIDGGFGVLSRATVDDMETVSEMAFADVTLGQSQGQIEERHRGDAVI